MAPTLTQHVKLRGKLHFFANAKGAVASLEENYEYWNHSYDWSRYFGDGWSERWGGPEAQWQWAIYPRVRQHLRAHTILEIGPGFGRWTQFLKDHCEQLIIVDISEKCIHACRQRFDTEEHIVFRTGNGYSLDFLEDASVDFVFSFESLIHTEIDILSSYLGEFERTLKDGGSGFLHHSNQGSYASYFDAIDRMPRFLAKQLQLRGLLDYDEWRARTVTAGNFREAAQEAGLAVSAQELVPWGGKRLIDCFTTFHKGPQRETQVMENPRFVHHADDIKRLQRYY